MRLSSLLFSAAASLSVLSLPIAALAADLADNLPVRDQLHFWLRADQGIQLDNEQRIAEWRDQSDHQLHAGQENPELRPTLDEDSVSGNPVVSFNHDAGALLSTVATAPLQQWTVFIVAYPQAPSYSMLLQYAPTGGGLETSVFHLITGPADGNGLYLYGDGGLVEFSAKATQLPVPFLPVGRGSVASVVIDGYTGNTALFRNGTPLAESSVAFGNLRGGDQARPFHIGAAANGGLSFKGAIAELIMYSSALSQAEREAVEAYLMQRYDIPAR